jgi:AcrR family transcriptional regulator
LSQKYDIQQKSDYHHGDLRQALIDAASEMVREEGLSNLSLRKIARRVGVTHSAPYRHFEDKRALVAALAEAGFAELHDYMVRERDDQEGTPTEALYALGLAYVLFAADKPYYFRLMFGPEVRDEKRYPKLAEAHDAAFALLHRAVEDCQNAGLIRDGSPQKHARTCWTLVHGIASLCVNDLIDNSSRETIEEVVRASTTSLFYGLARR